MLRENQTAPDFTLPDLNGPASHFYDAAAGKLAVLVFYKFSCPVCQLALPFVQRIYDAYGDAFYFVAIAQDPPDKTKDFQKEYRISMPTLMDMSPYPVSQEYGLETVPSIFLVNPDHGIRFSGEGFVKQELLNLADVLAEKSARTQIDVFGSAHVPEFKPG